MPEKWHDRVLIFAKVDTFPYEFYIDEIIKSKDKGEVYCICKSESKSDKETKRRTTKIILTELVVKYLISEEVPDSNMGLE